MTDEERLFFRAVGESNLDAIAALLDLHPELSHAANHEDDLGVAPLHVAASVDAARLLLSRGADLHARDSDGWTPLHRAQDPQIALLLIAEGADVNARDNADQTPLHTGSFHSDVAAVLIAHGADVNARDERGTTPLHSAAEEDYISVECYRIEHGLYEHIDDDTPIDRIHWKEQKAVAELLIAHGADVNATDDDARAPLHEAAFGGFVDVARLLVDAGAEVNARDSSSQTPLHLAACRGRKYAAEFLVDCGADVNALDEDGMTPLDHAIIQGELKICEVLRKHDGVPHSKVALLFHAIRLQDVGNAEALLRSDPGLARAIACDRKNPLLIAAELGCVRIAELLLDNGADVNPRVSHGASIPGRGTPLAAAIHNGHSEVVSLLLDNGADTGIRKGVVESALCVAIKAERTDIVRMLLDRGADVNGREWKGSTPLHHAAFCGNLAMVHLLIDRGADVNAAEVDGETPLRWPVWHGNTEIVRELIASGADVTTDRYPGSHLWTAAYRGHTEVLRLLIASGADTESTNPHGETALHYAAEENQPETAEELIRNGTEINARSISEHGTRTGQRVPAGTTPLGLALMVGAHEAAEVLRKHGAEV